MKFETWECVYCGWILRFEEGRKDVSTWCLKCHDEMERRSENYGKNFLYNP